MQLRPLSRSLTALTSLALVAAAASPRLADPGSENAATNAAEERTDERMRYKGGTGPWPAAPLVGEWIGEHQVTTLGGDVHELGALMGEKGLLIALSDPDCPLSAKYAPALGRVTTRAAEQGFGVLIVNVLSEESARAEAERGHLQGTLAVDVQEELPRALQARTTNEVFLIDSARTLRYRGVIDDQYGLGYAKEAPDETYLADALDAVAAGVRPLVEASRPQGCLFGFADEGAPESATPLTYHARVSRILQRNCQTCHRAGGVGPFALETYEQAVKRKGMIEWVVQDGLMPPWFADDQGGPWSNDTSLTQAERDDLLAWIAGGTPEGDAAHAPLSEPWVEGWTIGEPDLVVNVEEAFEVPAEGVVEYQYFFTQLDTTEDRWVQAMEVLPGASEVVHHVLVFLEHPDIYARIQSGDDSAWNEFQGGARGYFASHAPGQAGIVFPEGSAKRLPAGAWLKFQIHYTPNGTPATDRTKLGLIFSDEPNPTEVRTTSAANQNFAIPPQAFDHEVKATYRFPEAAEILSLLPHTHLRGMRFRYELTYPDGTQEDLLEVPFYDFNWQFNYELLTPKRVPEGTRMTATAWYDNSEYNPANPAPDEWVRFGEQTFEEMMVGYVNWVPAQTP